MISPFLWWIIPTCFFCFLRLSRGVLWKNFLSSRLVWKAGEVPGGDAELLPFYFGHSRRYHGCGKLRTRVGLVERRHLCDTRKGWDVRCEMIGDEDGTRMRWNGMWCLGGWKHENMACGTLLALSGDDFQWFTTMSAMESIIYIRVFAAGSEITTRKRARKKRMNHSSKMFHLSTPLVFDSFWIPWHLKPSTPHGDESNKIQASIVKFLEDAIQNATSDRGATWSCFKILLCVLKDRFVWCDFKESRESWTILLHVYIRHITL